MHAGRQTILALDVDGESLGALRQAFPAWDVAAVAGATATQLLRDWDPAPAGLLVIGALDEPTHTLGLCRGLRGQAGRARTPLLVLVSSAADRVVAEALRAGADGCLTLPVDAKELLTFVARVQGGNRPGRHTLGLHRAQRADPWRDDGGEA